MYSEKPNILFRKYALPQMIGLLLNLIYLIVDGILIDNYLGRKAMAAVAISVPVIELLIALSLAISIGSGIMISTSIGNGNKKKANNIFNLSLFVIVLLSIFIVFLDNFLFMI